MEAAGTSVRGRFALLAAAGVVAVGVAVAAVAVTSTPRTASASSFEHLYPDLQTVVPRHLNFVNSHQRELLRFSNGIANTGPGPWALRPDMVTNPGQTIAVQELRTSNAQYECGTQPKNVTDCYEVVHEEAVSAFEFHPTHNHWHTADVARFEVRSGSPDGPVVGGQSIKVGFCLIDLYKLEGKASTNERVFWECERGFQGVASGWVDQYHQATDGQEVELTGIPDGDYFLVSTTDPTQSFLDLDRTNNTAWVSFRLSSPSKGNRKVTVTGTSPCATPGLCGIGAPNRG